MVSQPKETPIQQVHEGATPADYDAGFLSRVISSINLVFRSLREWIIDDYVTKEVGLSVWTYAMYGGMASSGTATTTIGAGWDTLECDTVSPVPLHMGVNLINNSLSWPVVSINALYATLNVTHDESNGSREFYLRAWNITKGEQVGVEFPVAIARNQPGTIVTIAMPLGITAGHENDELVFQVGNTDDSINVVRWDAIRLWSHNVGQFLGDINGIVTTSGTAAFSDGFSEAFR